MVDTENQTEGHAVSDERDDINGRGRTAVATQPLRPTGKRTRQVTEAVEAEPIEKVGETKAREKKKAKAAEKRGPARNPLAFVWTYLKQVVAELRKVIWPNRKQMSTYTVVVIAFLAFMVALIGLVDLGLAKLVLLVLG